MAFSFCLFCGRHLPRGIAAGIFLFRRQEIARQKNTHFFMAGERGNTSKKTEYKKNKRYDVDYQTSHFIRPCFLHTGPKRGTCFFRGLSAAAFSSLLVFSQQCFSGIFHFPLFFAGICGGPKRRPNPLSAVPFMGISPPLPAPGRPQKQVEK